MTAPFIYITTHAVAPEDVEAFRRLSQEYTAFLEANEPRMLAHHLYLDAETCEVALVQIHPDPESADEHVRVAGHYFPRGTALGPTVGIDVYGEPGPLISQTITANLERGVRVNIHAHGHAGFSRRAS